MIGLLIAVLMICLICALLPIAASADDDINLSDDSSDFVLLSDAVPDVILEIRYYSTYSRRSD